MTIKMMTGKQVNFLKELVGKKLVPPEEWAKICREYKIKSEEDLYHLNVEQASALISRLLKIPNRCGHPPHPKG